MVYKYSIRFMLFVFFLSILPVPMQALQPDKPATDLRSKEFFKPDLRITSSNVKLREIGVELPNRHEWDNLFNRYGPDFHVYIDTRSGAPSGIIGHVPMIPGKGADNHITVKEISKVLGKPVARIDAAIVADLVRKFLMDNQPIWNIDLAQIGKIRATQVTKDLWQVSISQDVSGNPVRYARIAATINNGNLVAIGTETWSDVRIDLTPRVTGQTALDIGFAYAGGKKGADRLWKDPTLEIIPYAPQEFQTGESFSGPVGQGIRHRLVWAFGFQREPDPAKWEVLVDAQTQELLAFEDKNLYVNQKILGSVYPLTSTEACPSPEFCGVMQQITPMPWANTGLPAPNDFTNSSGVFDYPGGLVTTSLNGKYIRITDTCGPVSKSANGSINLGGTNGQHDCTTPGSGGAGNTAASRSAFYELNKIAEQARGWLPGNIWLQSPLTSNMNLNQTCNAYYDYVTVNFFKSGGGCRNTGEIAAVFDHEWGHGLDDNDAAGTLSNSSEAYADIAAIYRYQASCVGYGFYWTYATGCPQTADGTGNNANESQVGTLHCDTNCSGVRDADWAKHNPNTPDTALGFVCSNCGSGSGPCARQVHCAAAPVRQAAWDLVTRDLTAIPFQYDSDTAFLIGNKLFYQGSGNVGAWHSCTCGATSDGCGAANGYIQWLTADDDNGNLNDGTPHMTAIYAAFNRHGIACNNPAPVNSGCGVGPTTAPVVSATAADSQITLNWNAVSEATNYWVLRTEGVAGCDYGKVNLTPAGYAGTSYVDTQVLNGRSYHYNVVAVGSSAACFSTASTCASATPVANCTLPDPPSNQLPVDGAVNIASGPALDWSDVSGALSYDVEVATDSSFNNIVRSSNIAASTWTVSPELNYQTTYYWRVRAINSCDPGAYGTAFQFTTVSPPPGTATYDPGLKAPRCSSINAFCDSYVLLTGRDGLGPEPNQPNTINNSCTDGTSGTFHIDESNDRIKISTLDGTALQEGKPVKIEVTVWADATYYSYDRLTIYHTSNANNPSWVLLANLTPPGGGSQTLSINFTLPAGTMQAIRAVFRYGSVVSPCYAGTWDDHDDLIFAVSPGCGAPSVPALLTPADASTTVAINPTLDWSDVAGATSYDVQVATDASFSNVVRSSTGLTSSTWIVSPALSNGTLYYWRSRANNDCGSGSWSSAFRFTTALAPTPDFSIACNPASISIAKGKTGNTTCTISSLNSFSSPVTLSCSGTPTKVSCAFSPNPVTPPPNTTINSTLTIKTAPSAKVGSYSFYAMGTSGSVVRYYWISLTITRK